jgi:tripartite-type tricarboxylate transporter receptor subunit TctC
MANRTVSQSFLSRRTFAIGALACIAPGVRAADAAWPSKPITIVVPFSPGGATDVVARTIGMELSKRLNTPVIIENRPGAGGVIAAENVRRQAPDGYTLFHVATPFSTEPVTNPTVHKYDPVVDFTPIARTSTVLSIFAARKELPFNDIAGLIAYAKANPGKLSIATTGVGSSDHIAPLRLEKLTGTKFIYVHYKGSAQGIQDMLSGAVDLKYDAYSSVRPFIDSGKLKGLALGMEKRSSLLPDMPIIAETIPGFVTRSYTGLVGPAGMPNDVVIRLNREVNAILAMPDVREKLNALGLEPAQETPQQFTTYLKEHAAFQREAIRGNGGMVTE